MRAGHFDMRNLLGMSLRYLIKGNAGSGYRSWW